MLKFISGRNVRDRINKKMESRPIFSYSSSSLNTNSNLHEEFDSKPAKKHSLKENNWIFSFIKKRHVLTIYAFFGFFFAYAMRANLSVAIVDMSKSEKKTDDLSAVNELNITSTLPDLNESPENEWSPILQGYVLSSFFYGYIFTQLPAAFLTTKYGGKLFFGAGIGICAALTLFIPIAAKIGPSCLIFVRILQGLTQGFVYPSMHCLWSKWSPPVERSSLATFAFSGSYIGSVFALSMGGMIAHLLSWQYIFYIFGSLSLIWTVLWFLFISEAPAEHPYIDFDEKLFIESTITQNKNVEIPWKQILKSSAVWAIVCAHFAENWGFYTMLTEMPTFLAEIMKYKIDKAGIFSALPYLTMAIVIYLSGFISDCLIKRKMSYTLVRKIFCCSGLLGQFAFMSIMALSNTANVILVSIVLAVAFGGMAWASFGVNHLDIGAGYANVLMSISNTFATLPGIVSPILTGHIITDKVKSEWNIVFWLSAVMFLLGSLLFGLLGTGELQPWAASIKDDPNRLDEKKSDEQYASNEGKINLMESGSASTSYDTLSSTVVLKINK